MRSLRVLWSRHVFTTRRGGGGNSGFQPIPVGNGWVIVEIQNRTTETVTTVNNYSGTNVTEVITKNNNDGQGGLWYQNGVPLQFEPGEPASGNVSARWEVQGTFFFRLQYQGEGSTPSPVPIECWQEAYGYHYEDLFNNGNSQVSNGLGSPQIWSYEFIPNCNKASQSIGGALKIINATGTEVTYETPQANAVSYSNGWNAAAYSAIAMSLRPTNKSIAIWNSASPIYKAGTETETPISLSFPNSSAIVNVMATTFTQEVVTPYLTGVTNYAIQYEIARPWQKKHRFYGPVPMGGGVITYQWTDLDPAVPGAFFIAHEGSASPMGTMSTPDSFRWDSGSDQFSPPHFSIPASPNLSRICDYVQLDEQFNVHGNILELSDKSQPQETLSHELKYNWADGVTGSATATYKIRDKKYDELETLHSGVVYSDLLGWKPLTEKMPAGTHQGAGLTEITTVSYLKEFVVMNETIVSLAAANRNPYVAGLAALIGFSATALTTEEVPIGRIENSSYNKVWPSNWLTHIQQLDPPSYEFIDHIGNFRWQTQILESSNVDVVNTKKFFTRGYQGTAPRYSYSRDALQGLHRTVYWLVSQEDTIPAVWWTS